MGYRALRLRISGLRLFTLSIASIVLLLLGVSLALLYMSQKAYFTNRNFRVMAAIGDQVDESVVSHTKLFTGLMTSSKHSAGSRPEGSPPAWFREAKDSVPSVHYLGDPAALPDSFSAGTKVTMTVEPDRRADGIWLKLVYAPPRSLGTQAATLPLRLEPLLDPIFRQSRYLEAFESLMLATAAGDVWMSSAQPRATVRVDHLSSLVGGATEEDSQRRFAALAHSTNVVDVTVNGSSYKLFIQPCCASLRQTGTIKQELVIAGLVRAAQLNSDSLTISFSFVLFVSATLLILLVAWPFLKLVMMGEAQRITTGHVLLATASTVGGLALLTVVALDVLAYVRLSHTIRRQLESLANDIKTDFRRDVSKAFRELDCLTERVLAGVDPSPAIDVCSDRLKADHIGYDFFALVGDDGKQRIKVSTSAWGVAAPLVNVASRAYFQEAINKRLWTTAITQPIDAKALDRGIHVASVRSMTNGEIRAVLASRTIKDDLPVATLTLSLPSLIDPLVLPGFQFAVIDAAGFVLFHSDSQRNLSENLFAETDFDRRLRAVVETRRSRMLGIRYWGRTHDAYVTPIADGVPFTLVTLYDKHASWALQQEWILAAFALVLVYVTILTAALALAAYRRRSNQASWAWPQPDRWWQYLALSVLYITLHIVFWRNATSLQGWQLDVMGLLAPAIALAATFFVLHLTTTNRTATTTQAGVTAYAACAVLGLSLAGVVPAVAFFATSHDAHTETYTKYRQLKLAQALPKGLGSDRRAGEYHTFFFETMPSSPSACTAEADHRPIALNLVPALLQNWLPYQSDASAEMRELLRDGEATDTWRWNSGVTAEGHPCVVLVQSGTHGTISSEPLRFFALQGQPSARAYLLALFAIFALLGVVCCVVVRFISRKLLLTGLPQPLLDDTVLSSVSGENEWLLVNRATVRADEQTCYIDMTQLVGDAATDGAREDPWLAALVDIDRCDSPVVVANVDARLADAALAERKVSFLEEVLLRQNRTIVLSSKITPSLIANRHSSLKHRWETLLPQFIVRDLRAAQPARNGWDRDPDPTLVERLRSSSSNVSHWWRGIRRRPWATLRRLPDEVGQQAVEILARRKRRHLDAILSREASADAIMARICDSVQQQLDNEGSMSPSRLMDLISERAARHYRELWAMCTAREKLVLGHLAQDGLVNTKSRDTVRRLVAKGLIRTLPQVVLMNRTFERFLLSAGPQAEIAALEGQRESSAWDEFRLPLALAMAGLMFFVVTQKEIFDSTLAAVAAMGTAIPAFVKALGLTRDSGTALASARPPDNSAMDT